MRFRAPSGSPFLRKTLCVPRIDLNGQTARQEPQDYDNAANADIGPGADTLASPASVIPDSTPEEHLFTYVIARRDLEMPPGKLGSQIAHASRLSLLRYLQSNADRTSEFLAKNSCGSVVALQGDKLRDLERARDEAEKAELPWALFSDSDHVLLPHFDGSPVITSLAIGPAPRAAMRRITKRFRCI